MLRSAVSGIRARSAVRRGECLEVGVESDKNGGLAGPFRRSILFVSSCMIYEPVAPVAYQVILEPGIGQVREFEPRRMHTRINSLGLFLVDKLTCGKRESVS